MLKPTKTEITLNAIFILIGIPVFFCLSVMGAGAVARFLWWLLRAGWSMWN